MLMELKKIMQKGIVKKYIYNNIQVFYCINLLVKLAVGQVARHLCII